MTYRDDHDAALARINALEAELRQSEAARDKLATELDTRDQATATERDQFAAERDQVATERSKLAAERELLAVQKTLIPRSIAELTPRELDKLHAKLLDFAQSRESSAKLRAMFITLLCASSSVIAFAVGSVGFGCWGVLILVLLGIMSMVDIAGSTRSTWMPVLDVLRTTPEQLVVRRTHGSKGSTFYRLEADSGTVRLTPTQFDEVRELLVRQCPQTITMLQAYPRRNARARY